jgi:hypothetical protein
MAREATDRRRALHELVEIIREGVATGALRQIDARLAALAIFGMCNWIAWWYRPEHDGDAEGVAELFCLIITQGLALSDDSEERDADPVARSIALLRAQIDELEHTLDATSRAQGPGKTGSKS